MEQSPGYVLYVLCDPTPNHLLPYWLTISPWPPLMYSPEEVVASSPRFRRKSSTLVDGIHDHPNKIELAPAQLYSTESGRLFHSGRIVIIMVGLPARGKTCVVQLCYCRSTFSSFPSLLFTRSIGNWFVSLFRINRHISVAIARYLRWWVSLPGMSWHYILSRLFSG